MINKNKNDNSILHYNDKGELHNENGPAVIWSDGAQFWYMNGDLHNENGPAVIHNDDVKFWFVINEHISEANFKQYKIKQFINNNNNNNK